MKKGVLLIIVILVVIPMTIASVSVTGPDSKQYNVGNNIGIQGVVSSEQALDGFLQLEVICAEAQYKLQSVPLSVQAESQVEFNQLSLPIISATASMKGLCHINANVIAGGKIIETAASTNFEVTTGLRGKFSLGQSQVQLGDSLLLTGEVYEIGGKVIDGSAEIYFVQDKVSYHVGFSEIKSGKLNFGYLFTSGFVGPYSINLLIRDSKGNEQKFENVESFSVTDQLHVFVDTNVNSVLPGDHVNVYGSVKTIANEYVGSGTVEIKINGESHSSELDDSQFTYDLFIDPIISSGEHSIVVAIKDVAGNRGSATTVIKIKPVATSLSIVTQQGPFDPNQEISIQANLFDQASDVMDQGVTAKIYDSNNKQIEEIQLFSGETYPYTIPKFAVPGDWYIKATFKDGNGSPLVVSNEILTVSEIESLEHYIIGEKLFITNTGNVEYTQEIEIEVDGIEEEYIIRKSRNLDPNETISIDLSKEIPSGSYSISFPTGFAVAGQDFVNIQQGKSRTSLNWMYTIVALLFIGGLSFILYSRVRPVKKNGKRESKEKGIFFTGISQATEKGGAVLKKEVKEEKLQRKKKLVDAYPDKKINLSFEQKENIEDFKKRTLTEIRRVQEKEAKQRDRSSMGGLGYLVGKSSPPPSKAAAQEELIEKPKIASPFSIFD